MTRKLEPGEYVLSGRHGVRVRAVVEGNSITIKRGSRISAATPSAFIGRHPNLKQERDRLLEMQVLQPRNEDGQPVADPAHAANFEVMKDISAIESDDGKPLTPHTAASLALAGDIAATRWRAATSASAPIAEAPGPENWRRQDAQAAPTPATPTSKGSQDIASKDQPRSSRRRSRKGAATKPWSGHTTTIDSLKKELRDGRLRFREAIEIVTLDIQEYLNSQRPTPPYSLASRVKSEESLEAKYRKKYEKNTYKNLEDFDDIAGIRIVLYSIEDVQSTVEGLSKRWSEGERIGIVTKDVVENGRKFKVPEDEMKGTWDRMDLATAEDTWYTAHHFVVSALDAWGHPTKCEVQVTEIMNHAINEIGHDLVYKRSDASGDKAPRLFEAFWALRLTLQSASDAVNRIAFHSAVQQNQLRAVKSAWGAPFIDDGDRLVEATPMLARELKFKWTDIDSAASASVLNRVPQLLQATATFGAGDWVEDFAGFVDSVKAATGGRELTDSQRKTWVTEYLFRPYQQNDGNYKPLKSGQNPRWLNETSAADLVLLAVMETLRVKDPAILKGFDEGHRGRPTVLYEIVKNFMSVRGAKKARS